MPGDDQADVIRLRRLFAVAIAPWMRAHLKDFRAEGVWLDRTFDECEPLRRELRRLRKLGWQGRRILDTQGRALDLRRARTNRLMRLHLAIDWIKDAPGGAAASPTERWSRRALLILWLAFDAEAGSTLPHVTSMQDLVCDHVVDPEFANEAALLDHLHGDQPWDREWIWARTDPDRSPKEFVELMRIGELAWATLAGARRAGEQGVDVDTATQVGLGRLPVRLARLAAATSQLIARSTVDDARRRGKIWSEKRGGKVVVDLVEVCRVWPWVGQKAVFAEWVRTEIPGGPSVEQILAAARLGDVADSDHGGGRVRGLPATCRIVLIPCRDLPVSPEMPFRTFERVLPGA